MNIACILTTVSYIAVSESWNRVDAFSQSFGVSGPASYTNDGEMMSLCFSMNDVHSFTRHVGW